MEVTPTGMAATSRRGAAHADPANEHRNSLWGAPRIHGELLRLGFEVAQSSVAKYMVKRRLRDGEPSCTITRQILPPWTFSLSRPSDLTCSMPSSSFGSTADSLSGSTPQHIRPPNGSHFKERRHSWNEAPGYMIRDRDRVYGAVVTRRLRAMGIRDRPIAPASPWPEWPCRTVDRIDAT